MKVLVSTDFSLPASRRRPPFFFKFFVAALKQSGAFDSVDTMLDKVEQEMIADDALLGGSLITHTKLAMISLRIYWFPMILCSCLSRAR